LKNTNRKELILDPQRKYCAALKINMETNLILSVYCVSTAVYIRAKKKLEHFISLEAASQKIAVHFEPFVPEGGHILVHGKSKVGGLDVNCQFLCFYLVGTGSQ
jgi:hypothetical protein